jgi:hypothetical protein
VGNSTMDALEWLRKKLDGGVSGAGCACWHHLGEVEDAGWWFCADSPSARQPWAAQQ